MSFFVLSLSENSTKRFLKSYKTSVSSWIDGKYEKSYDTRVSAIEYLKSVGYTDATIEELNTKMDDSVKNDIPYMMYGRTWLQSHFEQIIK